ncbi:MAG TPA: hypothetical protein VN788_11090 [Verrucomicrobiae bacterium]|nr:hypothetical protein [Verrucomicrobiae bacterium]
MLPGAAYLDDDEFLAAFYSFRLAPSEFHHADHLRLAWLEVHRQPIEAVLSRVRAGIQAFAAHHDASHIYHETITTAWVRLIATHDEKSFDEFLNRNEHRLNLDLLHRFWTPALLRSDEARARWMPPNLRSLPI